VITKAAATEVLLDTNTYLRLAKRIRPAVGLQFGQVPYVVVILNAVEDEVHRNPKLQFKNPWFDEPVFAQERMAKQTKLTAVAKQDMKLVKDVLLGTVQLDIDKYTSHGRSPPGPTDCWLLAYGQVKGAIVVTDDLGMHTLAAEVGLKVWHGYELLAKLKTAKIVDNDLVRAIYDALERNSDMTETWRKAKHKEFIRIFGPPL
jgi:predicted nuclease of predicted toxin-antitoxin system